MFITLARRVICRILVSHSQIPSGNIVYQIPTPAAVLGLLLDEDQVFHAETPLLGLGPQVVSDGGFQSLLTGQNPQV